MGETNALVGIFLLTVAQLREVAEQFAKADGGKLEATFWELDGLAVGQQAGKGLLPVAHFFLPELVLEPVLVPAVLPFGDVVFGDFVGQGWSARVVKFLDNDPIWDTVLEHAIYVL